MKASGLIMAVFCGGLAGTAERVATSEFVAISPQKAAVSSFDRSTVLMPGLATVGGPATTTDPAFAFPEASTTVHLFPLSGLTNKVPQIRQVPGKGMSVKPPLELKPGVYQAAPYTMTVIVPEAHLDDGALVGLASTNADRNFTMRVIRPELRLIPRERAK